MRTGMVVAAQHSPVAAEYCPRLRPPLSNDNRCLSDIEMRVHLAAEDIEATLEAESARALQRIPAAVQELALVRVRPGCGMQGNGMSRKLVSSSSALS